jgi:predicted permease
MRLIEEVLRDTRYAIRQLRRTPGVTLAVILCLALGIGANTAIFAAIDAVMLRILPVNEPQNLFMLTWSSQGWPHRFVSDILGGGPVLDDAFNDRIRTFSYATFQEIRERTRVFSTTFAVAGNNQDVNAQIDGSVHSALMQGVSGNYFQGLGVSALLGRTLTPNDDQDSQPAVAVVSHRFWKTELAQSPQIVGRTLIINGSPMTIVGVAPSEFFGLTPGTTPDFWVTLGAYMGQQAFSPPSRSQGGAGPPTRFPYWKQPTTWWLQIFGRRNAGVTEDQARAELQPLFDQSLAAAGPAGGERAQTPTLSVMSIERGVDRLRQEYSASLLLLMGTVGLVLMIAAGNVAALLLGRASARQREISVRLSLGAGRRRLVQQLLTESVLLALTGGIAGLLFAFWGDSVLVALLSSGGQPLNIEPQLNATVLAFTVGISILTGILFGSLPAFRASRTELFHAVKQTSMDRHRFRSARLVVAAQVALCVVLVTSAGLCLRTLQNLNAIDAGFDTRKLLLFTVRPGLNGYSDEQLIAYYETLKRQIESIPGVRSVSLSTRGPLGQGVGNSGVVIPGYTKGDGDIGINRHQVGPDYFETLGIPILLGRGIGRQDGQNDHKVVVVNEKFVRDFFHGDNPLGRAVRVGGVSGSEFEIVGVVKDAKYNRLQNDAPATIYYPYQQFLSIPTAMAFEVRGLSDVSSLINPIQREAALLDRNVPITNIRTQTQLIEQTFMIERTFAALSAAFGSLALVLVGIGLYGTISYSVTRQTKEIGIRIALGARRETIVTGILRQTLSILAVGLGTGLFLAFMATPLLASRLFGLAPHDISTTAGAGLLIVAVSLLAGYLPARRASAVDPMSALRHE